MDQMLYKDSFRFNLMTHFVQSARRLVLLFSNLDNIIESKHFQNISHLRERFCRILRRTAVRWTISNKKRV